MKFGIIGAAHGHIASFANSMIKQGHEFAGIYDPVKKRTKVFEDKFNVPVFDTPEQLLDLGVEVVGTSAVNNTKIDIYEMCEKRGVHVIADKPMVTSSEHYERLCKVIDNGKIQLGLLLTLRFSPPFAQLKKVIESGDLGEISAYEFHNPHNLNPVIREDWHFSSEENGGPVIDLIIHCADLYNWYTGGFKDAVYMGRKVKSVLPEKETFYDYADVYMNTEDGPGAYFKTGWLMPECAKAATYKVLVTGSKGVAVIENGILKVCKDNMPFTEVICDPIIDDPTVDFLKGLKGEKRLITHQDILKATKMTLDMNDSVKVLRKI